MVIESEGLDCNLSLLLILWATPATVDDSVTDQYPKSWYSHDKNVLWWQSLCCRTNALLATFLSKFDNSVLLLKDLLSSLLLEVIELHVDCTSGTITTGVFIDIDNFKILKVTSWLVCTINRLPIILIISLFFTFWHSPCCPTSWTWAWSLMLFHHWHHSNNGLHCSTIDWHARHFKDSLQFCRILTDSHQSTTMTVVAPITATFCTVPAVSICCCDISNEQHGCTLNGIFS